MLFRTLYLGKPFVYRGLDQVVRGGLGENTFITHKRTWSMIKNSIEADSLELLITKANQLKVISLIAQEGHVEELSSEETTNLFGLISEISREIVLLAEPCPLQAAV